VDDDELEDAELEESEDFASLEDDDDEPESPDEDDDESLAAFSRLRLRVP
jgi:hypothetical protein